MSIESNNFERNSLIVDHRDLRFNMSTPESEVLITKYFHAPEVGSSGAPMSFNCMLHASKTHELILGMAQFGKCGTEVQVPVDVTHRASHVDTSKVSFLATREGGGGVSLTISFELPTSPATKATTTTSKIMKVSAIALLSIIGVVAAGKPQLSVRLHERRS